MKMQETFMGKIVPPAVHGSARELVEACRADDWNKACNCVDCTQLDCYECFFSRAHCNNTAEDLKRFADEYEKVHPSAKPEEDNDSGMPEIKPGDVIIYECYPGNSEPLKLLAVGEATYGIAAGDAGSVKISSWGGFKKEHLPRANAVYRGTVDGMIPTAGLRAIAELELGCYPKSVMYSAKLIWKREEAVKELTVDEVSEKLGYKVKIVGKEK